jgi:hypothetical protein
MNRLLDFFNFPGLNTVIFVISWPIGGVISKHLLDFSELLNMSYSTDSYIILTLKMESVYKNTIFGLKMSVKSGLEKIFLKFLHAGDYFPLLHKSAHNLKFSNKNNYLPAWRDFKIISSRPLFTIIFRPKMVVLVTDFILRVKPMYESVK